MWNSVRFLQFSVAQVSSLFMLLIIQSSVLSAAFTVAVPLRALVAADTVADVVFACWALVAVHVTHYKVLRLKPGPQPLPLDFVH